MVFSDLLFAHALLISALNHFVHLTLSLVEDDVLWHLEFGHTCEVAQNLARDDFLTLIGLLGLHLLFNRCANFFDVFAWLNFLRKRVIERWNNLFLHFFDLGFVNDRFSSKRFDLEIVAQGELDIFFSANFEAFELLTKTGEERRVFAFSRNFDPIFFGTTELRIGFVEGVHKWSSVRGTLVFNNRDVACFESASFNDFKRGEILLHPLEHVVELLVRYDDFWDFDWNITVVRKRNFRLSDYLGSDRERAIRFEGFALHTGNPEDAEFFLLVSFTPRLPHQTIFEFFSDLIFELLLDDGFWNLSRTVARQLSLRRVGRNQSRAFFFNDIGRYLDVQFGFAIREAFDGDIHVGVSGKIKEGRPLKAAEPCSQKYWGGGIYLTPIGIATDNFCSKSGG